MRWGLLAIAALLSACSTYKADERYLTPVPASAYLNDFGSGDVDVTLVRDTGLTQGMTTMIVKIDDKPAFKILGGEFAKVKLPYGTHLICAEIPFFLSTVQPYCYESRLDNGVTKVGLRLGVTWPDAIRITRER